MIDWGSLATPPDLAASVECGWARLGLPGTWWAAGDRVDIAIETRAARDCLFCRERKEAVSPYAVKGEHDRATSFSPAVVDAIHRITTDAGRLTQRWHDDLLARGLGDESLVELIAIVATVVCTDTMCRALGIPLAALPTARPGEPGRKRPPEAFVDDAWVPTLRPRDASEGLALRYARLAVVPGIYHALSLVPEEQAAFMDLAEVMYVPHESLYDFTYGRALSRVQLEVVSTTVSAANDCHY